MARKWHYIDTTKCNPGVFGLNKLFAVRVREHDYDDDVRNVSVKGWYTVADLMDYNPITGKKLQSSKWFIFTAKGE